MRLSLKCFVIAAAVMAGAAAAAMTVGSAEAAVRTTGHHRACYDSVAIRQGPDRPARDNLKKGQTFVVTGSVGGHYVYGYKLVNGVHGWVRSSSIDKSCR